MELYKSKYSDNKKSRNSRSDDNTSKSFRNSRNDRFSRDRKRESATVTCADCGTDCEVPFVPKTDRPVYCSDCFRQNKSRNTDDDRFSRNDRESRYSRDDRRNDRRNDRRSDRRNDRRSSRDERRSKNSRTDKFLKKQESFYSDGSDKFYESLKEKLFEILGGKICSSCGFRDERALGFSHKFDENAFDDIHRGGAASSWGKYISEPNLAREELKVLCLNCNQINQPVSKPKSESRPKRKKSKYFPR